MGKCYPRSNYHNSSPYNFQGNVGRRTWFANQHDFFWFTLGSGRTLRETALESLPIMKLLTSHFVSSWSLLEDVKVCDCGLCLPILHLRTSSVVLYDYCAFIFISETLKQSIHRS